MGNTRIIIRVFIIINISYIFEGGFIIKLGVKHWLIIITFFRYFNIFWNKNHAEIWLRLEILSWIGGPWTILGEVVP